MAVITQPATGAAPNDGSGAVIRDGAIAWNLNDTNINNELVALLTAIGLASGATDMGAFTGNTITDNATLLAGLQDLENALETTGVLSAGYVPNAGGAPAPADSLEAAIAKLHHLVNLVNEADRIAGDFDASVGTFPTVASGGTVAGNTIEAGYYFTTNVPGTIDGISFQNGDIIRALVDGPSTTTIAGNWAVEYNRVAGAYEATTSGQTLAFQGLYKQGDYPLVFPAITALTDGEPIHISPLFPWGTAAMASAGWTPTGGDTIETFSAPSGSVDILTAIPDFATTTWSLRIGGAPSEEQQNVFADLASLTSATGFVSGDTAHVTNDPDDANNTVYLARGVPGAAASSWKAI